MVAIILLPFSVLGIVISTCVTRPWLTDQKPWLTDQIRARNRFAMSCLEFEANICKSYCKKKCSQEAHSAQCQPIAKAISHQVKPKLFIPRPPRLKLGSSDLNQTDPFKPWNQSSLNKYVHMNCMDKFQQQTIFKISCKPKIRCDSWCHTLSWAVNILPPFCCFF